MKPTPDIEQPQSILPPDPALAYLCIVRCDKGMWVRRTSAEIAEIVVKVPEIGQLARELTIDIDLNSSTV
jgi:hypothetical protein